MVEKEFDTLGRNRPIDYAKQLAEVRKRAKSHLRSCLQCLRFETGLGQSKCQTGKQIDGHERVVLEAQRRREAGQL